MSEMTEPRSRLEAFLQKRCPGGDNLKVTDYEPITGGYSRAMARAWAEDSDGRRGYIVRADPPPGQAIIDTDRAQEWALLTSLSTGGHVPLPAPLWFDEAGDELGSPAIVMEMIDGEALIARARRSDPSEQQAMAMKMGAVGARIHTFDVTLLPDHIEMPASWDEYMDRRIEEWADAERAYGDSNPFMRLIAAYLKANKPAPAPLTLVHGDFQIANLLIDKDDEYYMVDWELAHIGDPREDLGWMMFASVTQPPDIIREDPEAFYAEYRELTGLSEEIVNTAAVDYFIMLAAGTVFMPVMEQLGLVSTGETTGMQVTYMSNAVAGMHNVLMSAMARHRAATRGGA
jgi:aminoglycoside phosphotransferase (APT) family kinase protein